MAIQGNEQAPEPTALETPNVFLDTQVYRRFGHNLRHKVFDELRAYISDHQLVLHTTDITMAEVERQISEFVGEAAALRKKDERFSARWRRKFPDLVPELPPFDQEAVARKAMGEFRSDMISGLSARQHEAVGIPAEEIFRDYFQSRPPFRSRQSKEFPDAFVVKALEKWCIENEETMYVVGVDKAMAEAAEASPHLLVLQTLEALLQAVAILETPDIVSRAADMLDLPNVQTSVQAGIAAQVDQLIPVYVGGDLADAEVVSHRIGGEVGIDDFAVLSSSSDETRVLLRVDIPIVVEILYDDMSSATYDREDDIYFGVESASVELEAVPSIRVFVKLRHSDEVVAEVQIISEEFSVYDDAEQYY